MTFKYGTPLQVKPGYAKSPHGREFDLDYSRIYFAGDRCTTIVVYLQGHTRGYAAHRFEVATNLSKLEKVVYDI